MQSIADLIHDLHNQPQRLTLKPWNPKPTVRMRYTGYPTGLAMNSGRHMPIACNLALNFPSAQYSACPDCGKLGLAGYQYRHPHLSGRRANQSRGRLPAIAVTFIGRSLGGLCAYFYVWHSSPNSTPSPVLPWQQPRFGLLPPGFRRQRTYRLPGQAARIFVRAFVLHDFGAGYRSLSAA